jgi:phosphoribosyl 1,2-cyclic phosphodiesterase
LKITFYGVRGSCPCPSPENQRYGGNTACVVLAVPDEPPIVLDLGTGLRGFGQAQPEGVFNGRALVTHLHWDHVQGLPFFPPIHRTGSRLDVYGPTQATGSLGEVFGNLMRPPYFPVRYSDLKGDVVFHDVWDDKLALGNAKVTVRSVPHCGPTVGYRVEWGGVIVTYISDHQAPRGLDTVAESVLELCDGADVLIHDAQYTPAEFEQKPDWGHCTIGYSILVARKAAVRKLVLFHHDPSHSDDTLDDMIHGGQELARSTAALDVVGAAEGLILDL